MAGQGRGVNPESAEPEMASKATHVTKRRVGEL